jgi:molybdopterin/thiamine biosynthesis adenylyltransferase
MASSGPLLRPEPFERYRRHLSLPSFGVEGQRRLLEGSALLIGAAGLGCPLAQYRAAAGVGRIGLVDFDVVEASDAVVDGSDNFPTRYLSNDACVPLEKPNVGFADVATLSGGIEAGSLTVDPEVPRY